MMAQEITRKNKVRIPNNLRSRLRKNEEKIVSSKLDNKQKKVREPWQSPDGVYVNEVAAAQYLGKSVSRMQNMRCQRIGPKFFKSARSVYYRVDDLRDFIEGRSGW